MTFEVFISISWKLAVHNHFISDSGNEVPPPLGGMVEVGSG